MNQFDSGPSSFSGYTQQNHSPQQSTSQQSTSFFTSNQLLLHSPTQPLVDSPSAQSHSPDSGSAAAERAHSKQRTTSDGTAAQLVMGLYQQNNSNLAEGADVGGLSPSSFGGESAVEDAGTSTPYYGASSGLPPHLGGGSNGKLKQLKKAGGGKAKSARSNASERAMSVDSETAKPTKQAKQKGSRNQDKKKKAGRACASCQKAHLTCDDARPCARCVKKGCPEQCHDGARKKAKYLEEVPDELLERRGPHLPPASTADNEGQDDNSPEDAESTPGDPQLLPDGPSQTFSYDPMPYYDTSAFSTNEFGSEAANLEYAILSSMLNGNGFAVDGFGQPLPQAVTNGNMISPLEGGPTLSLNNSAGRSQGAAQGAGVNGGLGAGGFNSAQNYANLFDRSRPASPTGQVAFGNHILSPGGLPDAGLFAPPQTNATAGSSNGFADNTETAGEFAQPQLPHRISNSSQTQQHPQPASAEQPQSRSAPKSSSAAPRQAQPAHVLTAEEAYRSVTKPYPYAQSYHYLVRHLKDRFEKNDILRIIRALATFRPSLIALQMPLTEEDETFVERTFQRTLVELNKLISFSGTPTVVWRRTGEICLVGAEFCLLTGWSREELLGKKYIFELFDQSTCVEYYENFAKHAFESTSSSVTSQVVVLGPSGRPVPCAFCFSVRRDLFSCPFLIIGSFLPVLS